MAVEPQDAARFGRSSPVLRHWLAHSHGFVVRGLRGRGVVVKVYGLPGAPQTILVRTRYSRRRLRIPADAFDEVVPANKELVVRNTLRRATRGEPRPRRKVIRPLARATAHGVARFATSCGRGGAHGLVLGGRAAAGAGRAAAAWFARVAWPPARNGTATAARAVLRTTRAGGREAAQVAHRAVAASATGLQRGGWRGREMVRMAVDDGVGGGERLVARARSAAAAARERREARARERAAKAPPTLVGDRPE
jgi:hypothetical protein